MALFSDSHILSQTVLENASEHNGIPLEELFEGET